MEAHYTNNGSLIPHRSQAPSSLVFLMSIEFLTAVRHLVISFNTKEVHCSNKPFAAELWLKIVLEPRITKKIVVI
jgi:hypothetical protein